MGHVAHQIFLPNGSATFPYSEGHSERVFRHTQLALDLVGRNARVLDLACLEGGFSIEMALQGLSAVGVEGRLASVERCEQALRQLGLANCKIIHEDVRNLSAREFGTFDLVLCLGILYHLTAEDSLALLKNVYELCARGVIIDTHIALVAEQPRVLDGESYQGRVFVEFPPGTTEDQKRSMLLSSLNNETSFWFTEESLCRLLRAVGFTSVMKVLVPPIPLDAADRVTLVAFKGKAVALKSCEMPRQQELRERSAREILRATYSDARIIQSRLVAGELDETEILRQEIENLHNEILHLRTRLERYLRLPLVSQLRWLRRKMLHLP